MTNKKLYRNENDAVLGGVCNGLADYFEVDVTLIRVIFLVLGLFGGSGILIYLILWLVVPKKDGIVEIVDDKDKKDKKEKTMAKETKSEVKSEKVRSGSFLGIVLMVLGTLLLAERMFQFMIRWDYVWPIMLIGLGVYFVFRD